MLPPIARQKKKSIHHSPSKTTSPTPPSAPVSSTSVVDNNNTPTRQLKATQAASIAAIIECTSASRNLIPGLADLFSSNYKPSSEDNNNDTTSSTTLLYHSALPSVDAVKNATSKMINDKPPFITMSIKDTAPQLKLEDPPIVNDEESSSSSEDKVDFQRQLVVKGGVKGHRMSRATQGVTNGCYYYEAVIGVGSSNNNEGGGGRGVKRSFQSINKIENVEKKQQASSMNGHLRIGWSTREGDLQAPVGYNEHSYAIRDILGSRIHKSQREDKWGGISFGVGDVLGIAICLVESSNNDTTTASIGKASCNDTERKDTSMPDAEMTDTDADGKKKTSTLTNHIRFFINGKPMGEKGIAFDNVNPGTYHPAISCYKQGSAQLNFGPHFVYPPQASDIDLHPISEVCTLPPLPEEGVDKILSGDSTGKQFFSKKTDEAIESVFKEFIKLELKARYDAHMKHLNLHRKEIAALRNERGLSTDDLND